MSILRRAHSKQNVPVFDWRSFVVLAGSLALLFTLVMQVVILVSVRNDTSVIKAHQAGRVETASAIMQDQLSAAVSDLMVIAGSPNLHTLALNDTPANRARVAAVFKAFSVQKMVYDQIRFLNVSGMELVRLNFFNGVAAEVSQDALQNKADRYYFTAAMQLKPGELYISHLDLNAENGQVEMPYKPVIRIATPIGKDRTDGLLVMNLYAGPVITRLRSIIGTDAGTILLNEKGEWLVAQDSAREWGFMFGKKDSFASEFPAVWKTMQASFSGNLSTADGLYTYRHFYPPQGSDGGEIWTIVSLMPASHLPSPSLLGSHLRTVVYASGLVVLLILSAVLVYVSSARRRLDERMAEHDFRYHEVMATLGEGVLVLDADGLVADLNPEGEKLLGWNKEDMLGQDAHELIHFHPDHIIHASDCPIRRVALTGQSYRSEDERFMRRSGQSFRAGVNASALMRDGRVQGTVLAFRDITELKLQQEEIHHLAYHDTLTGLPNRRLLLDRLDQAVSQAQRHKRLLAVMFLDLDHFKEINDTLGHDQGDALLRAVARQLRWLVREEDTVARQGGDEFIILLPEIERKDNAAVIAARIVETLAAVQHVNGHDMHISASIGIAYLCDGGSSDDLLRRADRAMYQAKQTGRNRYEVAP